MPWGCASPCMTTTRWPFLRLLTVTLRAASPLRKPCSRRGSRWQRASGPGQIGVPSSLHHAHSYLLLDMRLSRASRTCATRKRIALRGIVGVLPAVQGAFQGRIDEQFALGAWLTGDRRPRIITIHGSGGQGKTALARVAAERFAHAWPGGVWAITLETVPTRAVFVASLARFLGVSRRSSPILLTLSGRCCCVCAGGAPCSCWITWKRWMKRQRHRTQTRFPWPSSFSSFPATARACSVPRVTCSDGAESTIWNCRDCRRRGCDAVPPERIAA